MEKWKKILQGMLIKIFSDLKLLKVLWKNYPRSAATWEKEENLTNCPAKLQEFIKSRHNK
jgi:hypothetical protein